MSDERRLDEILQRAGEHGPMPSGLIGRVESRIRTRRRLRVGATLAIVFVGGSASWLVLQGFQPQLTEPTVRPPALAESEAPETTPVRVELASGYLAQPLASSSPNVTILRVFERYAEPEPIQAPASELPGSAVGSSAL